MTFKFAVKTLFIIFSIATAVCGFRAARLWYQSSLPTPDEFEQPQSSMSDDIEGHALYILGKRHGSTVSTAASGLGILFEGVASAVPLEDGRDGRHRADRAEAQGTSVQDS